MAGIAAAVAVATPVSLLGGAAPAHSTHLVTTSVAAPTTSLSSVVTPGRVVVDRSRPIVEVAVVRSDGVPANDGTVTLREGATVLASEPVVDGRAAFHLPRYASIGTRSLSATYGEGTSGGAVTEFSVVVVKATARISPARVTLAKSKRAQFTVFVPAEGLRARGSIRVKLKGNSTWVTHQLSNGSAIVRMQQLVKGSGNWFVGPRNRKVIVRYLGNATTEAARKVVRVSVEGR